MALGSILIPQTQTAFIQAQPPHDPRPPSPTTHKPHLELGRQLRLGVQAVGEVDAADAAVGVHLQARMDASAGVNGCDRCCCWLAPATAVQRSGAGRGEEREH